MATRYNEHFNTLRRVLGVMFLWTIHLLNVQAQSTVNAVTQPDCVQNFVFTAAGNTATFNNITGACVNWNISYSNTGFSALTLTVQSAPNNAGVPGTWVSFAGTVGTGSNPNTSTTSATTTLTGYYPFMRVALSGLTGLGKVQGTLYGYKNAAGGGSGGGGGGGSISNLLACQNGSNTISTAPINLTTATTAQVIAASGSLAIKICSLSLGASGASNVGLVYGTGSNCGTGTTALTGSSGGYQQILSLALDQQITLPASQAFCISSSAAVTINGVVTYVQN